MNSPCSPGLPEQGITSPRDTRSLSRIQANLYPFRAASSGEFELKMEKEEKGKEESDG
jgi:hypothetical protein